MTRIVLIASTALVLGMLSSPASALTTGSYTLNNHPDGNAAAPFYGLRLDDLLGPGIYTFDFDDAENGADMRLDYDGSTIHIYGQAWGGLDTGSAYSGATLWTIDFTYTVLSSVSDGGIDDIQSSNGTGTISSDQGHFNLIAFSGSHSYAFQIGDGNGSGHRFYNGTSGWGWLNYFEDGGDPNIHAYSSDWLFTATPVPVPAALWLFLSSFLGLGLISRRR